MNLEPGIFEIYRSSAGSGKTYQLAVEYLKLILREDGDFRRIQAVTFTNKATNEMKARIIEYLFNITKNEGQNSLIETLCEELMLDEIQLIERAKKTLKKLLHGYSYFSVSTIDSFFQKIISAFTRDLGIQGNYNIEFGIEQVKEALIDRLFIDLDEQPALRKWLVHFTMSKIESNKSWDIRYDIRQLAGQIFYENFNNYYEALNEKISSPELLMNALDNIRNARDQIKIGIKEIGKEGVEVIRNAGLDLSDFYRGINGPAGLFYKMADGQYVNLTNSYLNNALQQSDAWFTKASKKQHLISRLLHDGLQELYERAFNFYTEEIIKENTYEEALKYFYNLGILSNLIDGLKDYRNENEVVLISDLSHLLKIVVGENDAPFIYEKTGSFYNHFLIDEFQDTSHYQWANFLPLVLNSLSAGNFNMIVGDVKQSIYRWRGGDWEILQKQAVTDVKPFKTKIKALLYNWRSLKNIISFNNTVFETLSDLLKVRFIEEVDRIKSPALRETIQPFSERFKAAYSEVLQQTPDVKKDSYEGFIDIEFIPNSMDGNEKLSWKDKVLTLVLDRLKEWQDHQYTPGDIAILVRTKDEGRKVANYLLDHKNSKEFDPKYRLDIVSSESLYLKASPAVNTIIYFIRLVIDQTDLVAAANFYFWLSILKLKDSDLNYGSVLRKISDPGLMAKLNLQLFGLDALIDFENYRSIPVIDLIEEITILLSLSEHKEEGAYLLGLQSAALEYLESNNNDLHAFIRWWFEEGEQRSIKPSLEQDAINILTIHQAKGLEFKIALIPFCSWDIDHSPSNDNIIWASSALTGLDQIPFYPLRYSNKLGDTHFIESYFNEKSLAYMDNLNLLYVAFTRAEEGLCVFSELPENIDRGKTVGDILLQLFLTDPVNARKAHISGDLDLRDGWNEKLHVFRLGQIEAQHQRESDKSVFIIDDYEKGRWQDKISIRKQADILSQVRSGKNGEAVNYGILLHDILSRIHTNRQVTTVLDAEERSGNITREDRQKLSVMLEELWKLEKVNDWLSGRWNVKTEVPVLPEKGHIRRMDRVMIKNNVAVIVDYKTGVRRHSDIDQVKDYKEILREMGYKQVEGYVLYLTDCELVMV